MIRTRIARATLASHAPSVKITKQKYVSIKGLAEKFSVINRARLKIAASSESSAMRIYFR